MAISLELKKVKAELLGVSHAKANLEIRIEEMLTEIERLKSHIEVQIEAEGKLSQKIADMEKSKV